MGLMNRLGVDLTQDAAEVEKAVAGGGLVPEGVHHAVLKGCRPGTANSGTEFRELTFEVLAGPAKGMEVEDTVYLPSPNQTDEKKLKTAQNRLALFGHRLGMLKKVQKGGKEVFEEVPGKDDFTDCLGATCFIEVKHEERKYTDKAGAEKKITEARLTFGGLLDPADKKCAGVKTGAAPAGAAAPPPMKDKLKGL